MRNIAIRTHAGEQAWWWFNAREAANIFAGHSTLLMELEASSLSKLDALEAIYDHWRCRGMSISYLERPLLGPTPLPITQAGSWLT
jgi:hypothetical protein